VICGTVCECGPNREPLACGFPKGHDGAHAWATLPTFPIVSAIDKFFDDKGFIATSIAAFNEMARKAALYDALPGPEGAPE
jgi:hypothetical protein